MAKLTTLQVSEPGLDGVFRHVEGLIHFLLKKDVRVLFAYSDVRASLSLKNLVATVEAHGGHGINLGVNNAPQLRDVPAALQLARFVRQYQPDIVHAHSSKAGGLVRLPWVTGNAKNFYTPHAYYGMGARQGAKTWVFNQVERLLAARGTTIHISKDEADFAQRQLGIPPLNPCTIHNPVDTERFSPASASERGAARSALGISEQCIAFGTVGRMSFQKDPETLYRALAPLLRANRLLRFAHLGQGELRERILQLIVELGIQDQVVFANYSEQPASFYHALDGFALASRYEAGWPIVVLEALATGLPMVCTLAPGTSGLADASLSHCWTAPLGDVNGLTRALESMLSDISNRRPSNHRSIALERFSPEACYGQVLLEYERATRKTS